MQQMLIVTASVLRTSAYVLANTVCIALVRKAKKDECVLSECNTDSYYSAADFCPKTINSSTSANVAMAPANISLKHRISARSGSHGATEQNKVTVKHYLQVHLRLIIRKCFCIYKHQGWSIFNTAPNCLLDNSYGGCSLCYNEYLAKSNSKC
uniref:Secreted protein n=1 Tax=Spironucleus salmonicida TaxID=348837 RepID=V6LXW6_9EUKA|eukprot:EST49093.1 Hypothetical protein SS50377_10645 [Spironucleus salmonicida]